MGLDLTLLPYDRDFSRHVLSMERNYTLFDQIKKLESMRLEKPIYSYVAGDDEDPCSEISEDKYGEPIRFVYAGDLAKLEEAEIDINKACLAFIKCLPMNHKVALYWG